MVKGKMPKKVVNKKKNKSRQMVVPRGFNLDAAATQYAQLLADPCHGPLVTGPFGDGAGGLISRFELDLVVNSNPADIGAAFCYSPSQNRGYITSAVLASDGTAFGWVPSAGTSPGWQFLLDNAIQYRVLSACLQISYPGSELSRAGIVSLGQLSGGVTTQLTLTTSQLRASSQYVERTPEGMSEVVLRPNSYDQLWSQPNTFEDDVEKGSVLVMSATGLPAGVGIRVRVVTVVEWKPKTAAGAGLVVPQRSTALSTNTLTQVLQKLDSYGDWMYHGALAAGKAASSVLRGVRAMGQLAYGASKVVPLLMG